MKQRTMARKDWKMITGRTYVIRPIRWQGHRGKISFLRMEQVEKPVTVWDGSQSKTIVAPGYVWIQLAFEGEYFWMTAMFDEAGKFCEIYIDMTDGNHTERDDPCFTDLYLDYVVFPEKILELDRDELESAYREGEISQPQYERTLREGSRLKEYLHRNHNAVIKEFEAQYRQFLRELR